MGEELNNSEVVEEVKPKWTTGRLVIGIISMVLFLIISLQSCAAGLSNALQSNGEISGSFGFLTAMVMLVGGIIGVVSRKSTKKAAPITACAFYWFGFFLSRIGSGSYSDLRVWGIIAFAFGCVYLFSVLRNKKEIIIGLVISAIYFILGII